MSQYQTKEDIKELITEVMEKHSFTLKEARMYLGNILRKKMNWSLFQDAYTELKKDNIQVSR